MSEELDNAIKKVEKDWKDLENRGYERLSYPKSVNNALNLLVKSVGELQTIIEMNSNILMKDRRQKDRRK